MIITIDGPAGCGKSTLAKALAKKLGILYIDTGATYRAAALAAKMHGIDETSPEEVAELTERSKIELCGEPDNLRILLDGKDVSDEIRTPEVSDLASRISTLPRVRRALVNLQRRIAEGTDAVLEGRDTGSVVFPDAELKIYLDASSEERAKRRADDWEDALGIEKIEAEITRRDRRDSTRADSPLTIADGAVIIDSTVTAPEEVLGRVLEELRSRGLLPDS